MKIKNKLFLCLIVITTILSGCSGTNTQSTEISPSPTTIPSETLNEPTNPQYGGELKLSMRRPRTLNPILNEDVTVDSILKIIFPKLAYMDESLQPVINRDILDSMYYTQDGMSVTVAMKNGNAWSDGEPMTRDDLIFTLDMLRSAPETAVYKETIKNILSFEPVDNNSVKINFIHPFSGMPSLMCIPIIPKHYYQSETDPASDKNMSPVGYGYYAFSSYEPSQKLVFKASDMMGKKPYIDQITVVITPDSETDFDSLNQGIIDMVNGNISDWGKYLASDEFDVYEYTTTYFDFIGFNFNRPIFNDKAVREAIAQAVPYEELVKNVYSNYAVISGSPINPQSWLYESDIAKKPFDIEAAKQTLINAGWAKTEGLALTKDVVISDKTTDSAPTPTEDNAEEPNEPETNIKTVKSDLTTTILVNSENAERVKIAEMLKQNLNEIGFLVEIISIGFDEYELRLKERNYDMVIGGYNLSVIPELSFMLSSQNSPDGTNYFDYKDPAMDVFLSNAFNATTEQNYKSLMSDLQKYIANELPLVSLAFRKSAVIANNRLHGDINPSLDNLFININEWFLLD